MIMKQSSKFSNRRSQDQVFHQPHMHPLHPAALKAQRRQDRVFHQPLHPLHPAALKAQLSK